MANVKWGEFHGICQLHGGEAERFGYLVDPNGHGWQICAPCINGLWDNRHWLHLEEQSEAYVRARIVNKLVNSLLNDEEEK